MEASGYWSEDGLSKVNWPGSVSGNGGLNCRVNTGRCVPGHVLGENCTSKTQWHPVCAKSPIFPTTRFHSCSKVQPVGARFSLHELDRGQTRFVVLEPKVANVYGFSPGFLRNHGRGFEHHWVPHHRFLGLWRCKSVAATGVTSRNHVPQCPIAAR